MTNIDISNLSFKDAKKVVNGLYKEMNLFCPKCKSIDIKRSYVVSVSNYGHLPKPSVDLCNSCGFKSVETFSNINFIEKRNSKIEQLLNKDGI